MKIGHRLMLGFVGVALLVGVVGLFSIYAINETVESFENGEKHFRSIVEASTELSSYAKRAEGHVTMFVMLHDEVDRKKFFERCQSVDKQIAILEDTVRHPDAVKILERIKTANTILPAGQALLEAYDHDMQSTGVFDARNHRELFKPLNRAGASIRELGVKLAILETELESGKNAEARKTSSFLGRAILIVVIMAFLLAVILGYLLSKSLARPIVHLKKMAAEIGEGRMDSVIDINSKDEIGDLADSFNRMVRNLQQTTVSKTDLEATVSARTLELAQVNATLKSDIAARKQIDERLRQSEEKYRTILERIEDGYFEVDLKGNYIFVNESFCRISDRSANELLGVSYKRFFDPLLAQFLYDAFNTIYTTGEPLKSFEYEVTRRDGSKVFVEESVSLKKDTAGQPIGFMGIRRDCTNRKHIEAQLVEARDVALESTRLKSEFLANMSHEIRTPMNGIIGMTELTLETNLNAEQREYLQMVKLSGDSLLGLINDILDFSKVEAGKLELNERQFDLPQNLREIFKPLVLRAEQKGLELTYHVGPGVPEQLTGDAHRLRQILVNLVGNAIKFTEKGEVKVLVECEAVTADQVKLHFKVRDTGIGIQLAKQNLIFEAFSQADGSTTRKYGGTGLGLAITSNLIKLMGGRIWVESPSPTLGPDAGPSGSTFHFTVQLRLATSDAQQAATVTSLLPPVAVPSSTATGLRVLLAEDNLVNQRFVVRILEKRGHTIEVAANGRDALAALKRERFDVVLMDVQMPEMNGFEATAALRRIEQGTDAHTPIIAITAHAIKGDRERCLDAGMDDYLSKPVRAGELMQAITRLVPSLASCALEKEYAL